MIVVTGATGHIGNVLVRNLLQKGEKVRALYAPFEDTRPLDGLDLEKLPVDILDEDSLDKAIKGSDKVYHLAGIIAIAPGKRKMLYQVNVGGTKNVLRSCRKNKVEKLVHTASVHAFAEPPKGSLIDETLPFLPEKIPGDYGKSKALAALEVQKAAKDGLNAVIVCPTGVIGPYDFRVSEMGHIVLDFLKDKSKIIINGEFDFVDVRDIARGEILAMEKGEKGEAYLMGGEVITVPDFIKTLEELTKTIKPHKVLPTGIAKLIALFSPIYCSAKKIKPRLTLYSIHTLNNLYKYSFKKAYDKLGYSSITIFESLKDSIVWFKENGYV